jgi:AAA15 family ATPase/GTPase
MKIKSLQLKNFKRFTDLTLQGIPDNAKLVLLIGSNGSGKSSVFDAFEVINKMLIGGDNVFTDEKKYYNKVKEIPFDVRFYADNSDTEQYVRNTGGSIVKTGNTFYGRSAVRYFPRIVRTVIGLPINVAEDADRPAYYIDKDNRFENDIDLLLMEVVKKVFSDLNEETEGKIDEVKKFRKKLNDAFARIFSSNNYSQLRLLTFRTPADGNTAQLIFTKGKAEIIYDLLSAGEKEIVNLLINLYVRSAYFTNTIYFFDEIDAHLNTKLQYSLLKEIVENWMPENCQFWTASHSLGFIQYAKESNDAVIFDFDDLDFDYPKVLTQEPKDNPNIYEIAVNKELLPQLFKDYKIYFVENKDKNYYSALGIPHVIFVQSNNKKSVYHKAKNGEFYGIIDRDFLTDSDIEEIEKQYQKLNILRLYSVENYLYHPSNLTEYYAAQLIAFDEKQYKESIAIEKEKVKAEIIRRLALIRTGYSFFEEPEHNEKSIQKRFKNHNENLLQVADIETYLNSNDFETFYKVFPMKDNATQLKERQNISKSDLAKTNWFKTQIEKIIQ